MRKTLIIAIIFILSHSTLYSQSPGAFYVDNSTDCDVEAYVEAYSPDECGTTCTAITVNTGWTMVYANSTNTQVGNSTAGGHWSFIKIRYPGSTPNTNESTDDNCSSTQSGSVDCIGYLVYIDFDEDNCTHAYVLNR